MSKKILASNSSPNSRRLKIFGATLPIAAVALIFAYQISTELVEEEVHGPQFRSSLIQKEGGDTSRVTLDNSKKSASPSASSSLARQKPTVSNKALIEGEMKTLSVEEQIEQILKERRSNFTQSKDSLPSLDDKGRWSFSGDGQGSRFHASFGDKGLNFEVTPNLENAKASHLRFRFRGAALGRNELVFSNKYPKARIDSEAIEFDHGQGLVEKYYKVDGGIEQFFVLERPLANNDGDLMLMANLESSATKKRPVAATQSGLKFWDSKNNVLINMSELIVIDAEGRKTHGQLALAHDQVQYVIDGEWLKTASYPVTIDPVIVGQTVVTTSVPFRDGFENPLGQFWCTFNTGAGRSFRRTDQGPYDGTNHFGMDSQTNGTNSRNELILAIDLSGQTNSNLFFFMKETGDEDNPLPTTFTGSFDGDGVSISEDGNTWFRVVDLTSPNISATYQSFSVDLAAQAAANNINLNGAFMIKFQQFDNFMAPTDGFFFDEVIVTNGPNAPAVVWDEAPSRDFGQAIVNGTPITRTFVLRNIGNGPATGNILSSNSSFTITSGGGAYNLAAGATQNVVVSFDPTVAGPLTSDLSATVNGQGPAVHVLTGVGNVIVAATLPFFDGFEAPALGPAWLTSSTNTGQVILATAQTPRTGNQHLQMDCTVDGTLSLNEAILTVDLSGQTTANLTFFMKETGDEDNALPTTFTGSVNGDGVSISADGNTWFRIVDLTFPNISANYQQFNVDLIAAAQNAGITPNSTFQIKFQQFDNFRAPTDGFFFDDVTISNGQAAPNIIFDPSPFGDFGGVAIGSSADLTFLLRNQGNATGSGNISLPAGDFSIVSGGGSYTLAPGETQSVTVRFSPSNSNPVTENLTATVNGGQDTLKPLSGQGFVPAVLSFDAAPDGNYGDVLVGNFRDLTFTLRNTGGSTAMGTIVLNSPSFTFVSGGGAYTLPVNATRDITVRFSPTQLGRTPATLSATLAGFPDTEKQIIGNGTTPPIISWAAAPNGDFGSVGVGSNSDRVFTLQNTGTVPASGSISVNNTNYQIVSGGGTYTVPAGGTRNVVVRFEPTQAGSIGATLTATLQNNANIDNPLSGVAQANPALIWDPAPGGDFGAVATATSKDISFVLRNQGNTAASGNISVNNALFTFVSGGGAYTLAAGATRTVVVRFSPTAIGPQNAFLTASIGAVPVANKGVTGAGIAGGSVTFDAAPDGNIGAAVVGGNTTRSFVLRNSSTATVTGTVAVANSPIFDVIQGSSTFSIGPNGSQTIVVRFSPNALGAQTDTLTATVDNANNSTVALTAEGVAGAAAKFPFSEGFESGRLRSFWQTNSTNEGRIRITSQNGPNLGNNHIVLDDAVQNTSQSLNELILTIDLSGQANAVLTFHHKEFNDADHPLPLTFQGSFNGDGVAISEDGQTWFGLINLTQQFSQADYQRITVDLAATAAQIGINLNGNFKIKFQQFDAGPVNNDGFAFDDIAITTGAPASNINVFDTSDPTGGARIVQRGTSDFVVMNLRLEASFFEDLELNSLSFSSSGSGHEVFDIARSRLYKDFDSNGLFNPTIDPQLGIDQVFTEDNGVVTYGNLSEVIPAGTSIDLLLVWDISQTSNAPTTFIPTVAALQARGVNSGSVVGGTPLPVVSRAVNVEAFVFVAVQRPAGRSQGGCSVGYGDPAGPESLILLMLALFGLSALRRFR